MGIDHSKKDNEVIGVTPCCGAPLLNPTYHHVGCKNWKPPEHLNKESAKAMRDIVDAVKKRFGECRCGSDNVFMARNGEGTFLYFKCNVCGTMWK